MMKVLIRGVISLDDLKEVKKFIHMNSRHRFNGANNHNIFTTDNIFIFYNKKEDLYDIFPKYDLNANIQFPDNIAISYNGLCYIYKVLALNFKEEKFVMSFTFPIKSDPFIRLFINMHTNTAIIYSEQRKGD